MPAAEPSPSPEPTPPAPPPALVRQALNGSSAVAGTNHNAVNARREPLSPDDPFMDRKTSEPTRRRDPGSRAPGP